MKVKIKKRFFVFTAFLLFTGGFIWLTRVEVENKQSSSSTVLAADTSTDSYLLIENKDEPLPSGNKIQDDISSYDPVTISHTIKEGETIHSIAKTYHADPQTIVDYPYNKVGDDLTLTPGQILIIPNGYIDSPPPEIPLAVGSGLFSWPAEGPISQYAFWWHPGAIDIAAKFGSTVTAAYPGKVIFVEKRSTGYGWHVVIEHGGGYTTLYGHMSRIDVAAGQTVQRGTRIGLVGSTGRSTGPHLHFEVKKEGVAIDPMTVLPQRRSGN